MNPEAFHLILVVPHSYDLLVRVFDRTLPICHAGAQVPCKSSATLILFFSLFPLG